MGLISPLAPSSTVSGTMNKAQSKATKEANDKRIGLILLGVLAIAAVFAIPSYIRDFQEISEPIEETTSQAEAVASTASPSYSIGDVVRGRDRAIMVTKVEMVNGIRVSNQFADPIDGDIVVVRFNVQNTGNESGNIVFSQFELEDSLGRKYEEIQPDLTYSLWREEQGIKDRSEDMYPTEARADLAAFRVAPDASGLVFNWNTERIALD